jgi:asparagine synthase (glutamine-hydrolysing)
MGGICGTVGRGEPAWIDAMLDATAHRGPSGRGATMLDDAALGQLWGPDRPRAAAIATSSDGRVRCVLGGSLFDTDALRERLAAHGRPVPPLDDAALVAELLAVEGEAALEHLDGAFVLAAHDERGVLLARDPLGERPLYYTRVDADTVLFASEIKAFYAHPAFAARPEPGSLAAVLVFSFIPGPRTMFQGVVELEPGCCVRLRPGQPPDEPRRYWRLQEDVDPQWQDDEGARRLAELCASAVARRLPPAGPVAAFLSGGVDSSAAVALLVAQGVRPLCFSAGFGMGQPNELGYARLVADHCRVEHRIIDVEPDAFLDLLPRIIWNLDDPLCDCITVPNYIMAAAAARESAVVFNGEGGDPLFGGPKNKFMILGEWYKAYGAYDRHLAYLASYHKGYDCFEELCTPELVARSGGTAALVELVAPYLDDPTMSSFLNRLMHVNIKLKGGQNILVKVDKMLAAHGVRSASPLFDRRLAELSLRMPPAAKRRGDVEKFAFKQAVEPLLPHPVVYRKKAGMGVPLNHWFRRTSLRGYAADLLGSARARERGYFRWAFGERLLEGEPPPNGIGRDRTGELLWMLLAIELWHRVFVDGGGRA